MPTSSASPRRAMLLRVRLGPVQAGLALDEVLRGVLLPQVHPLPGAPVHVKGYVDLAGQAVMVLDLASLLGLAPAGALPLDAPLLLCRSAQGGATVGLIVDEVVGLAPLAQRDANHGPHFQTSGLPLSAIVTTDSGPLLLLDVARLAQLDLGPQAHSALQAARERLAQVLSETAAPAATVGLAA